MERLLELDNNNNLVIHPEALGIKAYADLWERDTSTHKTIAIKELLFIWYLCSLDKLNPFKEYGAEERIKHIIIDVFGEDSKWTPDKLVVAAKEVYVKHNYTFNVEYLKAALEAARKTTEYFNNVNYDEQNDKGVYKYKIKEVISALKDTSSVIKELTELQDLVNTESSSISKNRIRGEGRQGGFEN